MFLFFHQSSFHFKLRARDMRRIMAR